MIKSALVVSVLGVLMLGSVGCQERVVGTENSWVGSQYRTAEPEEPEEDFGESLGRGLENTGDFLFGWTGLTGNKSSGRVRDIEMDESGRSIER
ncbi:MAG: hypothetical protein WD294_13980 [Phycisphaeraceae bacterium]